MLHGRRNIHSTPFDLTTAETAWRSTAAQPAGLGAGLYVADIDGDGSAEIFAAASGGLAAAGKVHLFKTIVASATPHDAEAADHVTFAGVDPTALAAAM